MSRPWLKRGVGIEELYGSCITSSIFHNISRVAWSQPARRCRQILWILAESWGWSFSSRYAFKHVSWSTHGIPRIERQSRIAAKHTSGARIFQGLAGNVGCSGAARCFRIVKCSCVWQGNCFLHILNLSQQLTRGGQIPHLMQRQFIISCLSRSICFFVTDSSYFFNFLGDLSLDFLGRFCFFILFLFEHDLPIDSPDKAPTSEFRVLDWFQFLLSISASASDNLLWAALSPWTVKFSFVPGWRYLLSDRACTLSRSGSLFPLDNVPATLAIDSPPRTGFLVLHKSALSHGFITLYDASCWLPVAAACSWKPETQ